LKSYVSDKLRSILDKNIVMPHFKHAIKLVVLLAFCVSLSGCWAVFARLGIRAGLTETMALNLSRSAGASEFAMANVAQANIGSVAAADASLLRSIGACPLSIEMRGATVVQKGRIVQSGNGISVGLEGNQAIRIITERNPVTSLPTKTRHFSGNKLISYTRYSADAKRLDFFMLNKETETFEHVMYGLKNASTRNVTFFGKNHAYLGRAYFKEGYSASGKMLGSSSILALGALVIDYEDHPQTSQNQLCADELINQRRIYFNQGYTKDDTLTFWTNLYHDCPQAIEVKNIYEKYKLDIIIKALNSNEKRRLINDFINEFPENQEAKDLLPLV